ncbi:hypothetical protein CDAR_18391 [Caerostris darwini]|uniref:Uncharacterized protein n=1 Tax=Caerostris darwini TaxID=1538125 RepID=A0AAV4V974_9ARAC|nr:hypothetical protein CDAR_18391 [Caerostris darwini]
MSLHLHIRLETDYLSSLCTTCSQCAINFFLNSPPIPLTISLPKTNFRTSKLLLQASSNLAIDCPVPTPYPLTPSSTISNVDVKLTNDAGAGPCTLGPVTK